MPGPWSEAIKGICYVKKRPYTLASFEVGGENAALKQWSAQASVPVMAWNNEFPKSTWIEQLYLAERVEPQPSLVPPDLEERVRHFGYCNEICGENGFGWCRRLMTIHQFMSVPSGPARTLAEYLAPKYGYSAEKAEAALANLLQAQRQKGKSYFMGSRLTALDIYWAAFAALIEPLPNDLCPISEETRGLYRNTNAAVQAAANPILMEHRDFIYKKHLELPIYM
jgi:glutathione S-transferase